MRGWPSPNAAAMGNPWAISGSNGAATANAKTLSYHAWRTACRSTTSDNPVQRFYRASLERTHDVRHARLNTQRKILTALWRMWRCGESFRDDLFFPATDPDAKADGRSTPETAGG